MCLMAALSMSALFPAAGAEQTADAETSGAIYTDVYGNAVEGVVEKGISVSKYQNRASEVQGGIDWAKVKADGVSFVMVRMGYVNDPDPYFQENMEGAAAAGLKTGVYLYTQAVDTASVAEEVRFVTEQVKAYPVAYPIAYDLESDYILQQGLTREEITELAKTFCDGVAAAGYRPMIYTNQNWLNLYLDVEKLTDASGQPYDIWYARYGSVHECPHRTVWQCTDSAEVDGVGGTVTLEYAFADYDALIPGDGWLQAGDTWYFEEHYRHRTGWLRQGETFYYLEPDGKMLCSTGEIIDGVSCVFGDSGALLLQEGWNQIGGVWYYLEDGGAMLCDTSRVIGGAEYRFGSSGAWIGDGQ